MPKYDYRCGTCALVYEKREGFDAPSVQACPECSGEARRVLTPPAIVFKGSGWYKTDSRGAQPAASGAAAPSETKTETKSETKTDTASSTVSEAAAAD